MAVLKCKMCGGDIELSPDKTTGVCNSCGSTTTLPKIDDEQKAGLFNRGNALRMRGEYDKAAAVFERIIEQDETDAEAHWCLALCRFGIEYVEDPKSGERVPTCHRVSYDSFFNDIDYVAAIEHSDSYAASIYTSEATRIVEIQKTILAISKQEEPFDVFICYKETTDGGSRTKDSTIAQDIYYELTNAGYKVFFSRITLEDKLGTEYEPYIFAALNSAKVMLVIGTSTDNFNSVWVKNEWSRFLSIMKNDRSRMLIPCYRDIDPYDLPDELAVLQSQDMSKIGFIQDITRGIKKILASDVAKKNQKGSVETVAAVSLERLIQNSNTYLKLNNYTAAQEVFTRVTKEYPEDHRGWWGMIICNTNNWTTVKLDQSSLNIWFSYVKQLASPQDFSVLEQAYVEYTKKISDMAADEEIKEVNNIINAHDKNIQGLQSEIKKIENLIKQDNDVWKQTTDNIDKQLYDNRNRKPILESEYKSYKTRCVIGGTIIGIAVLLFLIELGTEGLSFSLVLGGIANFLFVGWIASLIMKTKSNMNTKGFENALSKISNDIGNYEREKVAQKNDYDKKIANHNRNINEIQKQVTPYQSKIEECRNYLGLGKDRISSLLFAQRCAVFGVNINIDDKTYKYRKAAFGGKAEETVNITCPACRYNISALRTDLQGRNMIVCKNCGNNLELSFDNSQDAETPYEVTCPSCESDFSISKEILSSGSASCPTCGSILEFATN